MMTGQAWVSTVQYSTVQYSTVQYSTVQYLGQHHAEVGQGEVHHEHVGRRPQGLDLETQ